MSNITTEQHYKITLSEGSTYYGRTTLPGDQRYELHKSDVRCGNHPSLQEVYDKYGYDDWVHEWLGWETGNNQHHNKIEFNRVQADPNALNIYDGRCRLLEGGWKEYISKYQQEKRNSWTPEELEEFRREDRERARKKRANRTPEEHEEYKLMRREYYHKNK